MRRHTFKHTINRLDLAVGVAPQTPPPPQLPVKTATQRDADADADAGVAVDVPARVRNELTGQMCQTCP